VIIAEFFSVEMILTGPPDECFREPTDAHQVVVPLPPLPALVTMEFDVYMGIISAPFTDFLFSIRSAPALSSITFKYPGPNYIVKDIPVSHLWIGVDKWLARLAMDVKTKRSLTVVLMPWSEGNSQLEECLPEFRKVGGELKVESGGCSPTPSVWGFTT